MDKEGIICPNCGNIHNNKDELGIVYYNYYGNFCLQCGEFIPPDKPIKTNGVQKMANEEQLNIAMEKVRLRIIETIKEKYNGNKIRER